MLVLTQLLHFVFQTVKNIVCYINALKYGRDRSVNNNNSLLYPFFPSLGKLGDVVGRQKKVNPQWEHAS